MIETLYATDALNTLAGFVFAGVIGVFFGVALERAGLASSRKIAATFYFRDMTVVKVMFTAIVVAAAGLTCFLELGWLKPDSLNWLDTVYGAHVVGGLLLGIGMVVGGWCPGTAMAGLGSGRLDALLFLIGAVGGSVLFNEVFPWVKPLYNYKAAGIVSAPELLNISAPVFVVGLSVVAVVMFWASEAIERARQLRIHQTPDYLDYLAGRTVPEDFGAGVPGSTLVQTGYHRVSVVFLVVFSVFLVALAAGLLYVEPVELPQLGVGEPRQRDPEDRLMAEMESGLDHMDPVELAERLMSDELGLVVVDIRPQDEFQDFHIRGAVNMPASRLMKYLQSREEQGLCVLYSNGMTHPAQAADSLRRRGFANVYILTDGLDGFIKQCLKPASLRPYPVTGEEAERIRAYRAHFLEGTAEQGQTFDTGALRLPGLVDTPWLQDNLDKPGLAVIDLRPQPEYNMSHIPGSFSLAVDSLRGNTGGVPSVLLPPDQLVARFSAMGITPGTMVVLVYGERAHDGTLPAAALETVGHRTYAVLDGGFGKWAAERRAVSGELPKVAAAAYRPAPGAGAFIIDAEQVLRFAQARSAVIIDVRPAEYYRGEKSDEPRAGHIPGAVNRVFSDDTVDAGGYLVFRPVAELEQAYAALIPSKGTTVVVHCRTGHQASQTYFVLRHLLGYTNVLFYDAGWTEWSARPDLPIEQ